MSALSKLSHLPFFVYYHIPKHHRTTCRQKPLSKYILNKERVHFVFLPLHDLKFKMKKHNIIYYPTFLMMAVDESDSRGVWLISVLQLFVGALHCSSFFFSIYSFGKRWEHFAIVYFCNNMVPTWVRTPQQYSLFKNKHKTSFTSYSPPCCTSLFTVSFPQCAATDLHVTTWTPLGNVPLALPASVTALPLIIPLWV